MESLVNWEAIHKLSMPPMMREGARHKPDAEGEQRFADFYNRMARMETAYTPNQVNALPLLPEDTLLDMGCGPGRLSVPLAGRVKSVTALDVSDAVLRHCEANAKAAGAGNVLTKKMDFHDAVAGENVEKHDVAICSRSVALGDLRKLSTFAKRMAAVVTFANAPTIPHLLSGVFKDASAEPRPPFMQHGIDRKVNYNVLFNIVYDLGYEPNVRVVEDGFSKTYASREEAEADIITLGKVDADKTDVFKKNLAPFLSANDAGGVTFFMETRSAVIWWMIDNKKFF